MLFPKAVIIYGHGGDLGNLEVFAQGIRKRLPAVYTARDIVIRHITLKNDFFRLIETFTTDFVEAP